MTRVNPDGTAVNLELDRLEAAVGESVWARVQVANMRPSQHEEQYAVARVSGWALGHHGRERVSRIAKLGRIHFKRDARLRGEAVGDLLAQAGELEAGDYMVSASAYEGGLRADSVVVPLMVSPVKTQLTTVPRLAGAHAYRPTTAASLALSGGKFRGRYHVHSRDDPCTPSTCIGVEIGDEPVELHASRTVYAPEVGHLYWARNDRRLEVRKVNVSGPGDAISHTVKLPFEAALLSPAMTMANGRLWLPFTDTAGSRVRVARIGPEAEPPLELDLGDVGPHGAYACFWETDTFLHFVFASRDGYEVFCSRLPVEPPAPRFSTLRSVFQSRAPVVWIEGYVDDDAAFAEIAQILQMRKAESRHEEAYDEAEDEDEDLDDIDDDVDEEDEEAQDHDLIRVDPKVMLAVVSHDRGRYVCTRVDLTTGYARKETSWSLAGIRSPRILGSAFCRGYVLALLIADESGKLFYVTTADPRVPAVGEVAGVDVRAGHCPALASSSAQLRDQLYLRYLDPKQKAIRFALLEPRRDRRESLSSGSREAQ